MTRASSVFQVHLWARLCEDTHARVTFAPIRRRLLDLTMLDGETIQEVLVPAVSNRVMRSAQR